MGFEKTTERSPLVELGFMQRLLMQRCSAIGVQIGAAPEGNNLWYVYIVRCSDNSLYTGITKDLDARVTKHNSGAGARYTSGRRPVVPVYVESVEGQGDALRRECAIKKLKVSEKQELISRCTLEMSG